MELYVPLEERLEKYKEYVVKNPSEKIIGRLLQILFPGLPNLYGITHKDMPINELRQRTFTGIANKLKSNQDLDFLVQIPLVKLAVAVRYALIGYDRCLNPKFNYLGLMKEADFKRIKINPGNLVINSLVSRDNLKKANLGKGQILIDDLESNYILELVEEGKSAHDITRLIKEEFGIARCFKSIRRHYELKTKKKFPNLLQIDWQKKVEYNKEEVKFIEYVNMHYNQIGGRRRNATKIYSKLANHLNNRKTKFGFNLITFKEDAIRHALTKYWDKNNSKELFLTT